MLYVRSERLKVLVFALGATICYCLGENKPLADVARLKLTG